MGGYLCGGTVLRIALPWYMPMRLGELEEGRPIRHPWHCWPVYVGPYVAITMNKGAFIIVTVAAFCMGTPSAQAEKYEKRVTTTGLMGFPAFDPADRAGFKLGAWGGSLGFEYSPMHEVWFGGQLSVTRFSGASPGFSAAVDGRDYIGTLSFVGRYYHPQLTARYELLSGWPVAPHLELAAGYMLSHYTEALLLDEENRLIADNLKASSSSGPSVQVSLLVNARIIDMLQASVGVTYLRVFDDLYRGAIHIPLRLSFYWY